MEPNKRGFWWKAILAGLVLILLIVWKVRSSIPTAPGGAPAPAETGGGGRRGGGPGGPGNLPVPVTLAIVETKDVPIYLDGLGTVQAFNSVTVKVRVDGELKTVAFTEGQIVKIGDLLAEIDPRIYQSALDQALAKKAQDEALLANARAQFERSSELMAKKVLDKQTFDTQRFAVDQLAASVQADQAAADNARVQLGYTRILAPIGGRTGVRLVDQGNIVKASDQTGIVVINQLQPISLVFTLPEQNVSAIQDALRNDGKPLRVVAVDRDNTTTRGEGELAVVDNQIDTTTGTIKLKASFPNADSRLWPGQFVNARLLARTLKDALVVPTPVVQRGPQGTFAYVIKADQTAEVRPVKVAISEDGISVISEGLSVGEQVAVDGQYRLQAGAKVMVNTGNAPVAGPPDGRARAAESAGPPRPRREGGLGSGPRPGGPKDEGAAGAKPEAADGAPKPKASPGKPAQ